MDLAKDNLTTENLLKGNDLLKNVSVAASADCDPLITEAKN